MWAAFWDAFQEVGGRKIVVILCVLAIVVGFLFNRAVHFEKLVGVDVIYQGVINLGPWAFGVPGLLGQIVLPAGMIWMFLMVFAGCPQFVAMLEKGWRELTFSKGTTRWQLLLARYASLVLLNFALSLLTCLPLVARLWWHTGIPTWNVLGGIVINTFAFGSLLAIGALAATLSEGGNVALPIIVPFGGWVISVWLVDRERMLYDYITSEWGRRALDWIYYILPKCSELQQAASAFVQSSKLPTSWPVWTTGVFIVSVMVLTAWILERKSF